MPIEYSNFDENFFYQNCFYFKKGKKAYSNQLRRSGSSQAGDEAQSAESLLNKSTKIIAPKVRQMSSLQSFQDWDCKSIISSRGSVLRTTPPAWKLSSLTGLMFVVIFNGEEKRQVNWAVLYTHYLSFFSLNYQLFGNIVLNITKISECCLMVSCNLV